ncbi:hypothetical protein GOP47_0003584 [Adiantum capillus-veneris]|uniref:Cysteine protease n=1 Tax=Adiantum capillus-veneris TaxID=13818 RepID=A0A9D4V5W1_ADICA|nr:hypothetical protein GOP47_0003584 [Adiantum capillus-veneris]
MSLQIEEISATWFLSEIPDTDVAEKCPPSGKEVVHLLLLFSAIAVYLPLPPLTVIGDNIANVQAICDKVCLVSPDNPKADTSTYQCRNVKRMPMGALDPSLALGFYCRNQEDFRDLCERALELERKGDGAPMFTISQSNKVSRENPSSKCRD